MNEPIGLGDLVQLVHSCCGHFYGSPVFVVGSIHEPEELEPLFRRGFDSITCENCDKAFPIEPLAAESKGEIGFPISWLKRIPPLEELERETRKEEIEA